MALWGSQLSLGEVAMGEAAYMFLGRWCGAQQAALFVQTVGDM